MNRWRCCKADRVVGYAVSSSTDGIGHAFAAHSSDSSQDQKHARANGNRAGRTDRRGRSGAQNNQLRAWGADACAATCSATARLPASWDSIGAAGSCPVDGRHANFRMPRQRGFLSEPDAIRQWRSTRIVAPKFEHGACLVIQSDRI